MKKKKMNRYDEIRVHDCRDDCIDLMSEANDAPYTHKYDGETDRNIDSIDIIHGTASESSVENDNENAVAGDSKKSQDNDTANTKESKKLYAYDIYKAFIERYRVIVYAGQLFLYSDMDGYYKPLKDLEMQRLIRGVIDEYLKPYLNKSILSEVVEFLYSECEMNLSEEDIDKYKHLIPFKNCIYDTAKGKVYDSSPEYPLTNALRVDYFYKRKQVTDGTFNNFINSVTNQDYDLKLLLSQVMGYLLSSYTECKKAFFLIGPTGTGKTTLINLIVEILGKQNVSSVPFDKLDMRFNRVALYNKALNCSAELTNKSLNSIDFFKQITGNDYIQAEYKGKDTFSFKCRTKLLFAGNNYPNVTELDESSAFFDRLVFLPFTNQIDDKAKDSRLLDKLLIDSDAVIAFAIKGLDSLIKNNFMFTKCEVSEKFKENYIKDVDSIKEFVESSLICGDDNKKIFMQSLYTVYLNYCKENCLHVYDLDVFRRQMGKYGKLGKVRIGEQTLSGIRGLAFKV